MNIYDGLQHFLSCKIAAMVGLSNQSYIATIKQDIAEGILQDSGAIECHEAYAIIQQLQSVELTEFGREEFRYFAMGILGDALWLNGQDKNVYQMVFIFNRLSPISKIDSENGCIVATYNKDENNLFIKVYDPSVESFD